MKVRQLIEALSTLDPEMRVVLSSDSEGNMYKILSGFETYSGVEQEYGYVDIRYEDFIEELGEHVEDSENSEDFLVLYP